MSERASRGLEVDFILGNMALAVEAKASTNLSNRHLRGLRKLAEDHPNTRRVAVCLEQRTRRTSDGIDILPATEFATPPRRHPYRLIARSLREKAQREHAQEIAWEMAHVV